MNINGGASSELNGQCQHLCWRSIEREEIPREILNRHGPEGGHPNSLGDMTFDESMKMGDLGSWERSLVYAASNLLSRTVCVLHKDLPTIAAFSDPSCAFRSKLSESSILYHRR
jgi:hypothetical protein